MVRYGKTEWMGYVFLERDVQTYVGTWTNLAALPTMVNLFQRRMYFQFVVGVAAQLVSMIYHYTEATGKDFLGMNDGRVC
jgi:uncharacterized protein DUF3522